MEYAQPQPPDETDRFDGLAYDLWLPFDGDPAPAVVVLHGAGSRRANHADFARAAVSNGFVALTFDNRGHGDSEGELGARAVTDVQRLVHVLAERPEVDAERLALRGASMGGVLVLPGGDHRSAQHDPEVQGETLRWLSRVM